MAHHAYVTEGTAESARGAVDAFLTGERGFARASDPDIERYAFAQLSVDDARRIQERASRSAAGGNGKAIVVSALRFFHEAQNALLKIFEEPPPGATFVLIVPRAGALLPTLRSRLRPLPGGAPAHDEPHPLAAAFLAADGAGREKLVGKLADAAKADQDEQKQRARAEALAFVEGLVRAVRAREGKLEPAQYQAFMKDAHAFLPILSERSAPLKPILEHLRLVIPI